MRILAHQIIENAPLQCGALCQYRVRFGFSGQLSSVLLALSEKRMVSEVIGNQNFTVLVELDDGTIAICLIDVI
jgi:hypothetical protein